MFPHIHIGALTVSSFSTAMLVAFLVATWLGSRQARFAGVDPQLAWRLLPWAAGAGVLGAKFYSFLLLLPKLLRTGGSYAALGEVWYGGLIGGAAMVSWRWRRLQMPMFLLYDFAVAPVAFAHAIGRVGCFLVGDDYGMPTSLPIGVAFPHGAPPSTAANLRAAGVQLADSIPDSQVMAVHPTQLYEAAVLLCIGMWLWRRSRHPHRRWTVVAHYLVLYGAWRFGIEFLRVKDDHVPGAFLLSLTSAQLVSMALVASGALVLWRQRHAPLEPSPPLHAVPPTHRAAHRATD